MAPAGDAWDIPGCVMPVGATTPRSKLSGLNKAYAALQFSPINHNPWHVA
jgi:hypothetical protein